MPEGPAQTIEIVLDLRPLSSQDLETVAEFEQRVMNTPTTFPLSREELEEEIKKDYQMYGAFNGSNLVAKVGFTPVGTDSLELDIGVDPQYQNQRIGRRVMPQAIEAVSSRFPDKRIFLRVHPENVRGVKLYESS